MQNTVALILPLDLREHFYVIAGETTIRVRDTFALVNAFLLHVGQALTGIEIMNGQRKGVRLGLSRDVWVVVNTTVHNVESGTTVLEEILRHCPGLSVECLD